MIKSKTFWKKLSWHTLGSILIGLGVQTIIYSYLGAAPLDALTYYVTRIYLQLFNQSNFDSLYSLIGITSLVVGTIVTFVLVLVQRKKQLIFTWLNILLVSLTIFLWGLLFNNFTPSDFFILRLVYGISGIAILSIGVTLTVVSGLPAGPHEELLRLYNNKINNMFLSKLIVEGTYLVLAFIMMIISEIVIDKSTINFSQVGWFTIVTIILSSGLIHILTSFFTKNDRKKTDQEEINFESK